MTPRRLAWAAGMALLVAGCATKPDDSNEMKVAKDVLSLRSGTVTELKARRGSGPFLEYDAPPDVMLDVVTEVLQARVPAVFPNRKAFEVVAKERLGKDKFDDWYGPEWSSAVAVYVHPVPGNDARSKVEIHWLHRGKFQKGTIDWGRELPQLFDAALARRGSGRIRPL